MLCEYPIAKYLESTTAAINYIEVGIMSASTPVVVEGIERVLDAFDWFTPIFLSCDLTGTFIYLAF